MTTPARGSLLGIEHLETKDILRLLQLARRMNPQKARPLLRGKRGADNPAAREGVNGALGLTSKLLSIQGTRSVDSFHRELGKVMWEYCGMARSEQGLKTALQKIPALREEYWRDVRVLGTGEEAANGLTETCGRLNPAMAGAGKRDDMDDEIPF